MSKAVEDFYEFTQSKLMTYAREQDLKCSGELVLYVRIKGRDVRKYVKSVGGGLRRREKAQWGNLQD